MGALRRPTDEQTGPITTVLGDRLHYPEDTPGDAFERRVDVLTKTLLAAVDCPICRATAATPLQPLALAISAEEACPTCEAAVAQLIAARYGTELYPDETSFGSSFGVTPGTRPYAEQQARFRHLLARGMHQGRGEQSLSGLFLMRRDGTVTALAAIHTYYGSRAVAIGASVGDPASSLPMHTYLRGFTYPASATIDPERTPESALAELGRLAVATPDQLQGLVDEGSLGEDQLVPIARHGFDRVFALACERDRRRASPPKAYIFSIKPAHWLELTRYKGLAIVPLFGNGTAPNEAMYDPTALDAPYFLRWRSEIARIVPPEIADRDLAAAITYIAAKKPRGWLTLRIGLPYYLPCDEALRLTTAQMGKPPRGVSLAAAGL